MPYGYENQRKELKQKIDEVKNVEFENVIEEKDNKKESAFKKALKITAKTLAVGGVAYGAYRGVKCYGKKQFIEGYNLGSLVTTVIERTKESDLDSVGNVLGVNARGHKECSNRIWTLWKERHQ